MTLWHDRGELVKIDGGGYHGDFWRKVLEVTEDIQYPGYARPGTGWINEFAIGTNYGIKQFTKSILYDEKIGGSFHMAVGMGFEEAGGENKSAIHWDMICDARQDSEIRVDGKLLYKDGQFQI